MNSNARFMLLSLLLASAPALSAEPTADELSAELIQVLGIEEAFVSSIKLAQRDLPHGSEMANKVQPVIEKEVTWDKLKPEIIGIYRETFTEDELRGIIAFFRSPAGQAFREKQRDAMMKYTSLIKTNVLHVLRGQMFEQTTINPSPLEQK